SFLGGRRRLDRVAAEAAVDRIAAALGVDRLAAARGIHRVVNTTMAEGVRLVSVRRGVDPRNFALLAFGRASVPDAIEIAVQLDGVDWAATDPLPQIVERFHHRHEELYTYSLPDQDAVLVNARVAVAGILSALPQEPHLPEAPPTAPRSERRIYLDDWV